MGRGKHDCYMSTLFPGIEPLSHHLLVFHGLLGSACDESGCIRQVLPYSALLYYLGVDDNSLLPFVNPLCLILIPMGVEMLQLSVR